MQEAEPSPSLSITLVLLSAVLAATVSQVGLGAEPAFNVPSYDLRSLTELPLYLILGFGCGGVSVAVAKSVKAAQKVYSWVDEKGFPSWLHPISGGFLCGLIALVRPEVLYQGYENLNSILEGSDTVAYLLEVVLLKVVATSLCRASGLVGGLYAPSLFIGAAVVRLGLSLPTIREKERRTTKFTIYCRGKLMVKLSRRQPSSP